MPQLAAYKEGASGSPARPLMTALTLSTLHTLGSLHLFDPRMTESAEETSKPTVPWQHILPLHHLSYASATVYLADPTLCSSSTYCWLVQWHWLDGVSHGLLAL